MYGVKIHYTTLSLFYRQHKVTCRKPQYTYLRKQKKQSELMDDQKSVAYEIAELIKKGKQIVYVDESSFHRWLLPTRTWLTRDMVLEIPSNRGKSFTVIAAISEKQGLVHYSILNQSNTTETFTRFTAELLGQIKGDAVVYMDNFSAHHSTKVKEQYEGHRVTLRFLPAYSCTLNPIEKLWLVVKEKWRRAMIDARHELDDDQCVQLLQTLLEAERESCKNLATCHLKFLIKSLRDEFV